MAKKRLIASHHVGGLSIQFSQSIAKGLQLNIIQKIISQGYNSPTYRVIEEILIFCHCPTLQKHVQGYGPQEWERTAERIRARNLFISQIFATVAHFLTQLSSQTKYWASAAIMGHPLLPQIFYITKPEAEYLHEKGFVTVSQLFKRNDNLMLTSEIGRAHV